MPLRADIQALRGWAVLLVVLHHSGLRVLPAGYLGVDVFFVLSGFLITGLLRDSLARGPLDLAAFYLRRARRLLPAASVTGLLTGLAALWLLEPAEQLDLLGQLLGSASFSANIVLWRQTGYFDGAAELKPLLHMWSLAVEEQYYLLLPLLLQLTPARRRFSWVLGLTLASVLLCGMVQQHQPSAAFYWLPTRAWELGIGSVAALLPARTCLRWQPVLRHGRWLGLAAVLGLPWLPQAASWHPGPDALLIALGTALWLLYAPHTSAHTSAHASPPTAHPLRTPLPPTWLKPWVQLGNASYAVYLVHWPVFAFLNNAALQDPGPAWHLGAMALALLLGWGLHRGVEQPLRHRALPPGWRTLGLMLLGHGLLLALPAMLIWTQPNAHAQRELRRPNVGLAAVCDQDNAPYQALPACRSTAQARTLVWGDSFGMHLIPAMTDSTPGGVIQATRSSCPPLLGLAPMDDGDHPVHWAQACAAFNQSVLEAIASNPQVDVVVLSSPFMHVLVSQDLGRRWQLLDTRQPGSAQRLAPALSPVAQALGDTVRQLRQHGKRVVIVAPPPWGDIDASRCQARQQLGLWSLPPDAAASVDANCQLRESAVMRLQAPVRALLERVSHEADVPVLTLHPWLCSDGLCATAMDGVSLYRDTRHLSYAGAQLIGQRWQLGQRLRALAR